MVITSDCGSDNPGSIPGSGIFNNFNIVILILLYSKLTQNLLFYSNLENSHFSYTELGYLKNRKLSSGKIEKINIWGSWLINFCDFSHFDCFIEMVWKVTVFEVVFYWWGTLIVYIRRWMIGRQNQIKNQVAEKISPESGSTTKKINKVGIGLFSKI